MKAVNVISSFLRTSEKDEEKQYTKNGIILLLSRIIILGMVVLYLMKSFIGTYYHEIDSYVLPTISMEYRHSLIITQEDIDRAKIDYPQYYEDVDDFVSLRCSRLNKVTEDKWISYYFPSYSMCCMPLKLIFQLLGADQAWTFTVTNALFVIAALVYMYNRLKVPPLFRLLAVLLFVISPLDMYIQYISAEAMMFSLVTIALVMYTNGKYHLSALLISVASMTNPTVMGFGIVMVLAYLVKMFFNRSNVKIFSRQNITATLKYACFFLPCFIPFIFNAVNIGKGNPSIGAATLTDYGARVLSYLFDVNIGFSVLAPVTLIAFLALVVISLAKKDFTALEFAGFLLMPILAYSLMLYMNCVPVFWARYTMWNYPALFIGTAVLGSRVIKSSAKQFVFAGVLTASTAAMLCINSIPMYYFSFNGMSRFLLEYFPELYNPYRATFYAGTDGYSWGYTIDYPSFYFSPENGTLRKCLFRSTDEYKSKVISTVTGGEEDIARFTDMVNSVPSDGNFHYINISPFSGIKLWEKTSEEVGLVRENGTLLSVTDSFTVDEGGVSFELDMIPPERYTLYDLKIEFADGKKPSEGDNFIVTFFDKAYMYKDCMITGDNTMHLKYPADKDNIDGHMNISFRSEGDTVIQSFTLTELQEISSVVLTDAAVELPADNEEGVLLPAEYEPMTSYFLDIRIPEGSISEEDEVYCMVYYQKRFNHEQPEYKLSDGENRFLINSGDTTIVRAYPNNGFYVKFFGHSSSPVTVEYAALSIAQ